MSRDPVTPEEWQTAVDAAQGALALDAARKYGLVEGGPNVDTTRCAQILGRGAANGYMPAPDAVERFAAALVDTRPGGAS